MGSFRIRAAGGLTMPDRYSECGDSTDCDWKLDFTLPWVQYLDVGQGDGTFCYFPKTDTTAPQTVLIDLGSKKNATVAGTCARQFIYCALKTIQAAEGWPLPRLDYLFVTHGDGDHYNLIIPLLEMFHASGQDLVVGQLIIGGPPSDYDQPFRTQVIQPLDALGRLVKLADCAHDPENTASWTFLDGGAYLYLLSANYPVGNYGPKNPKSIVLMLEFQVSDEFLVRSIFMGDAEESVERAIMGYYPGGTFLRSDTLKLGHHGSQAGSSEEWVQTVHPYAVFASADMKWAHPYCSTLKRVSENTQLSDQQLEHGFLCGQGAGVNKEYVAHNDTRIGIFVNLTSLTVYRDADEDDDDEVMMDIEEEVTATVQQMETVNGGRFEMAVTSDGEVVISQGALHPGATMRVVYRGKARRRPTAGATASAHAGG